MTVRLFSIVRTNNPDGTPCARFYSATDHTVMVAMRLLGFALMTAEVTHRPAYREMIDTLRWEDMR